MSEKRYDVLSRRQVEGMIAEGGKIFILDQYALKADPWLQYHPGGDKAILHMVGRDATDEVTALHSVEAKEQMKRYRIGRVEERWINFVPPIQGGRFRRPLSNINDDSDSEVSEESLLSSSVTGSSTSGSENVSLLFDQQTNLRKRYQVLGDGPLEPSTKTDNGMAYLDSQTKEQISLDVAKYPSLDSATQDLITQKYRALNDQIKAEGLYQCNYNAYAIEVIRYIFLAGLTLLFLNWGWYTMSAFSLGCLWHQLVFSAHDAGHMGITHNFHVDTLIGIVIADFIGGLSLGWWKRNHNIHHIVTNSPEHDPDIEHMPFLAISHRLLGSLRSTFYERVIEYDSMAKLMLSIQKYTYFILLAFGRFNLYRLSWEYLLFGLGPQKGPARWHRPLEILGMLFFWSWYGYGILYRSIPNNGDRFVFLMVSHMTVMPLHAQLNLSHFAMSTSNLGPTESFAQKMLRTTMDIESPPWLDFFHGGLQFQTVHHLYPRIPRHNLRRAQKLVARFCAEVGIPYAVLGFVRGNRKVLSTLDEVSRQAAILAKCQDVLASRDNSLDSHVH